MKYNKDKREVNQACANELEGEITLQLEQRAANAPVVALDFFSVTAQLVLVTESRAIQITKLALLQKRLMAEGLKLYHKQYPFPFGIISKCARDSSFVLISIELNKQKKIRSNRHVLNSLPFYGPTRIQKKHDRSKLYFTRRLFIIQFDKKKNLSSPLRHALVSKFQARARSIYDLLLLPCNARQAVQWIGGDALTTISSSSRAGRRGRTHRRP